jgi:hypothetical protein
MAKFASKRLGRSVYLTGSMAIYRDYLLNKQRPGLETIAPNKIAAVNHPAPGSAQLMIEAEVHPNCARSIEGNAPLRREIHTVR